MRGEKRHADVIGGRMPGQSRSLQARRRLPPLSRANAVWTIVPHVPDATAFVMRREGGETHLSNGRRSVTKTNIVRLAARARSVGLSATIAGSEVCAAQSGLFEGRPRRSHRRARAWYEALLW
jgi:hypothetical protein